MDKFSCPQSSTNKLLLVGVLSTLLHKSGLGLVLQVIFMIVEQLVKTMFPVA